MNNKEKKIIHFQIPTNVEGKQYMSNGDAALYAQKIQQKLGDDYIVLITPFKCEKIN